MNKKWRALTRQFYHVTRKRFDLAFLPPRLLQAISEEADGDRTYSKLPFQVFVNFMTRAILSVRGRPSTRRLARRSHRPSFQRLSGIPRVSHQAIANRLKTLHLPSLQELFHHVSAEAHRLMGSGFKRRGGLKLFDCTTVGVSKSSIEWAANNGDKNAVRILLGLQGLSDVPSTILDASETTSDNTVFPLINQHLRLRETVVLDAGFTRLRDFQTIIAQGNHFIARMANTYHVRVLRSRQLPLGTRKHLNGWVLLADQRVLVGTPVVGGPLEARRVKWFNPDPRYANPLRVIWTDRFDLTPKQLFEIDRMRWRIEVQFRWLKNELGLDHLPSFDFNGVQVFFLLVMLAWIGLRLFDRRQRTIPSDQFSCAEALDAWETALEYYLLGEGRS